MKPVFASSDFVIAQLYSPVNWLAYSENKAYCLTLYHPVVLNSVWHCLENETFSRGANRIKTINNKVHCKTEYFR